MVDFVHLEIPSTCRDPGGEVQTPARILPVYPEIPEMHRIALLLFTCLLAACQTPMNEADLRPLVQAAVDNPARSESDRNLDPMRKPVDVVTFFGIQPGMDVIDVFGGGGYYTEILSYLVGSEGSVTLYNNNPWNNFVTKSVEERLRNNRLPNVTVLTVEPAELGAHEASYDAAIFILGMHDIYYEDLENDWPAIDVPGFLGEIQRLVKPGGLLGIIDHNASVGSDPAEVGKRLHRIDKNVVIRDVTAAGFTLEGESDLLANGDDDHSRLVFEDELRWKTDRSVLLFRRL